MRKRTAARALALQALCAFDSVGDEFDQQLNAFLKDPDTHADLGLETPAPDSVQFARRLAREAWGERQRIDALLERLSAHWSLRRMPPVDRNILRLGSFELRMAAADAPPQVVISEALELAERFADKESPAFINGVLDAVRRELHAAAENGVGRDDSSAEPATG